MRWIVGTIVGVCGIVLLRLYVYDVVSIASGSMEPTLDVGRHYVINKLAYHHHAPNRGDIVLLESPVEPGVGLVKRVIAVGGDRIAIHSKQVFLNGESLSEPYVVHKRPNERLVGDNIDGLVVPAEQVFVLGDNRDESNDSSVWKDPKTGEHVYFVPERLIQGRLAQFP